ncbi:MAG: c-type cytochrome [Roseinatronobacter sp.]
MSIAKPLVVLALTALPGMALAQTSGDAAAGEQGFGQCTTCHGIASPDGNVIHRVSPTGPNLWGVAGRVAGGYDGYSRYSSAMTAAGQGGITWTEANFVAFLNDPSGYLREVTGDSRARSNMNHKLRGSAEDIYAYLSQFGAN